jgi:hypothetical protein
MMRFMGLRVLCLALLVLVGPATAGEPKRQTENVIVVTFDGFRWQDFFSGADDSLFDKKLGGVRDPEKLKARYWRDTPRERREILLPFLWQTVAREGQIFGDASRNAQAFVRNGLKFSYPGYNELFCGFADPRIDSNDKKDNPNMSVLEFLNNKPAYKDRVAVFSTWDVFPFIFRSRQNGLKVQIGWAPIDDAPLSERQVAINDTIASLPRYWPDNGFDAPTMEGAKEHIRRHKPRVLFISLGETDEWGHGRRYDLYLDSAQKSDRFVADLWQLFQKMPEYQGKTTLIVTTDHGRGPTRADWTDHGKNVPTAEYIWIAAIGPDTPPLGVREEVVSTQSQVAATIATALGEDFLAASPKSSPALPIFRGK